MADVWFIRNVADTPAWTDGRSGVFFRLEPPEDRFPDTGMNISVLRPGEPGCRYHAESVQEDFLVLSGECLAIVEDAEHRLGTWDLLHCPAGVPHVLVGAGDGPCAVMAIGARRPERTIRYLVSGTAARHDASVRVETDSPAEAYADWPEDLTPAEQPWPLPGNARRNGGTGRPEDGGWFIRNVADTPAYAEPPFGAEFRFAPRDAPFTDTGFNITVLRPGEPNGRYHSESGQEDFLVLSGECVCIVDDVEHPMRAWDFFHCPGGTPHILVGGGDGPCAILMIGAKRDGEVIHYPVSEVAARYGASVSEPTGSPAEAYADCPRVVSPVNLPWPPA